MGKWLIYLVLINLLAFAVSAYDKFSAKHYGMRRVPEKHLFACAVLGGSPGLYLSFLLLHHKTRHRQFMIGVPAIFLAEAAIAVLLVWFVR